MNDPKDPEPAQATIPVLDEPDDSTVRYGQFGVDDWIAFAFFWVLASVVFLQFFTRYVLNDSLAWTEEIARYLLICVTFIGAAMAVRKSTHIRVEFLYLYLSPPTAHALSTAVDLTRIAFFAYATWLTWKVLLVMRFQMMVVIDWPLSVVYAVVLAGFVVMTARAVQVALGNWRQGSSELTRVKTEGRHQ